jgi:hypothetical protein
MQGGSDTSLVAFFQLYMGLLCFIYLICAIRTNVVFFGIFLFLVPTFGCLAGSYWHAAQGNASLSLNLQKVCLLTLVPDQSSLSVFLTGTHRPVVVQLSWCPYWAGTSSSSRCSQRSTSHGTFLSAISAASSRARAREPRIWRHKLARGLYEVSPKHNKPAHNIESNQ